MPSASPIPESAICASSPPDGALLAAFAAGSRAALAELAGRHERRLLGLAYGLCGGREAPARDAVQAMWVKVIQHASTFKQQSEVYTWLCSILLNECRTQQRRGRSSDRVRQAKVRQAEVGLPSSPDIDDEAQRVRRAVERLPNEEREAVLVCYHHGLSREQAAAALGLPLGTVKSRLRAAKQQLEAMLSKQCDYEGTVQ